MECSLSKSNNSSSKEGLIIQDLLSNLRFRLMWPNIFLKMKRIWNSSTLCYIFCTVSKARRMATWWKKWCLWLLFWDLWWHYTKLSSFHGPSRKTQSCGQTVRMLGFSLWAELVGLWAIWSFIFSSFLIKFPNFNLFCQKEITLWISLEAWSGHSTCSPLSSTCVECAQWAQPGTWPVSPTFTWAWVGWWRPLSWLSYIC